MKKTLLVLAFVVATAFVAIFMPQTVLAADRWAGPNCLRADDTTYFPYGFMCGTHPDYRAPLHISVTDSGGIPVGGSVQSGNTFTVTAGWGSSPSVTGTPRKNGGQPAGELLAWIYILGESDEQRDGIDNISGISGPAGSSGSSALNCPGDWSSGPDKVVGSRDIGSGNYMSGATNGLDESPVAFNPTSGRGIVNCHNWGRMVYWKTPPSSNPGNNAFRFNFHLDDDVESSNMCLRLNLSVRFDGDTHYFPPSGSISDGFPSSDPTIVSWNERITATHMVKQSDRVCFQVTKPPKVSTWSASFYAACNPADNTGYIRGRISHYNSSGNVIADGPYPYRIQVWEPGIGAWVSLHLAKNTPGPGSGSRIYEWTSAEGLNPAAMWGNGSTRAFRVIQDANNDNIAEGTLYTRLPDWGMSGPGLGQWLSTLDCVNEPPTNTVYGGGMASCVNLNITGNAYDPDPPNNAVTVRVYDADNGVHLGDMAANGDYVFGLPASYQDGYDHNFHIYTIDSTGLQTGPAGAGMIGCGQFRLDPVATGSLDNAEDPTVYNASNTVTPQYPGWSNPSRPAIGSGYLNQIRRNGITVASSSGGDSYNTRTYTLSFPVTSATAGDSYCSYLRVGIPARGIVQRDGAILRIDENYRDNLSACSTVHNKPYFKAQGRSGGLNAGGEFAAVNSSCVGPAGTGNLGSWHNNNNPTYTFGASSQLSTQSILNIIGVTSSHGGNSGNNRLAFANGSLTSHSYSPTVGGSFGGNYCINDANPTSTSITASGNYTLPTTTIPVGHNVSIFVDGNVRITGSGVRYAGAGGGWTSTTVPSFVIKARGNIYIDPSVTQLDGVYIAQQNGGNRGIIYTCGNGFAPMPANSIYGNCRNQLLVNGSFIAEKVNLMRSFGSIRDEKPIIPPGSPGVSLPLVWTCGGGSCNPSVSGMACTHINEPSEPGGADYNPGIWGPHGSHDMADNRLCIQAADVGSIRLAWSFVGSPVSPLTPFCTADWRSTLNAFGYDPPNAYTWSDNFLCSNVPISFIAGGSMAGRLCTPITEPSAGDHGAVWTGGVSVCIQQGSPPGPLSPPPMNCENAGIIVVGGTCAAEVFRLSPELYLSRPNIRPPSNNSIKYDSITSLPPVL